MTDTKLDQLSAPLNALQKRFGFEPDRVLAVVREQLGR